MEIDRAVTAVPLLNGLSRGVPNVNTIREPNKTSESSWERGHLDSDTDTHVTG